MTERFRHCTGPDDFAAIGAFLRDLYEPGNRDGNWFEAVWEYAYTHPWFDKPSAERIGIWEEGSRIVAAVLYELRLGEAFFAARPGMDRLKPEMLLHAETHLPAATEAGERKLHVFVHDSDEALARAVKTRPYRPNPPADRPMSRLTIPRPFPPVTVPPEFRLLSLAEDNDLDKVDRVLWRGFNHPGDPPPESRRTRPLMQSGPNFRLDLAVVVEAPGGGFVSYSGTWFDPANRIAYVEPVATDPDYRRRGLGSAAVLESIRRAGELGATCAYVGTDRPFYLSMGFERLHAQRCFERRWSGP